MTSSNVVIEQVLNKILVEKSTDFIEKYCLTEEYFLGYEDEFYFILDHNEKFGSVPDKMTFASAFPRFNFFTVSEPESYLYENIFNNRYYKYVADTWGSIVSEITDDPTKAMEKFKHALEIAPRLKSNIGFDIIKNAEVRLNTLITRSQSDNGFFIPTGFEEIDTPFNGGWSRGEDLAVIFGRTGNGKTFVLLKTLQAAFQFGNRVGFISPEMSVEKIGFRFDTLKEGFSNSSLNSGSIIRNEEDFMKYTDYINNLKEIGNSFIVAENSDFENNVTVSKLKQFIIQNKLDIVGIDGLTYMKDENYKKGDNKTTSLTNISADLIVLSKELHVPIIVALQANRSGVKGEEDDGTPDLETIRDSDGIAHSCTKVISIRQIHDRIDLCIKKNRDNKNGQTFSYYFDPNVGVFQFEEIERNANTYRRPQIEGTQTNSSSSTAPRGSRGARRQGRVTEF